MLTEQQVSYARQSRIHPVIPYLEKYRQSFSELNARLDGLKDDDDAHKRNILPGEYLLPFADEIEGLGFDLRAFDIISIWQVALQLLPTHAFPRYDLATCLSLVYCTLPIQSERWEYLFRKISSAKHADYLEALKDDKRNVNIFRTRLRRIGFETGEISDFVYSTSFDEIKRLIRVKHKDKEASKTLDEIEIEEQRRKNLFPKLDEIMENWSNGFDILHTYFD